MKKTAIGVLCMLAAIGSGSADSKPKHARKPDGQQKEASKASQPKADVLGVFGDWSAFASAQGGKKVCYMTARPAGTKSSKSINRGSVNMFVQHDQTRNVRGEVYIVAGFSYDEKKPVEAAIDGKKYEMTAVKDAAWIFDSAAEKAFVSALQKGSSLVVRQASSRGTTVTDQYSLKGFAGAKKAIDAACAK